MNFINFTEFLLDLANLRGFMEEKSSNYLLITQYLANCLTLSWLSGFVYGSGNFSYNNLSFPVQLENAKAFLEKEFTQF